MSNEYITEGYGEDSNGKSFPASIVRQMLAPSVIGRELNPGFSSKSPDRYVILQPQHLHSGYPVRPILLIRVFLSVPVLGVKPYAI